MRYDANGNRVLCRSPAFDPPVAGANNSNVHVEHSTLAETDEIKSATAPDWGKVPFDVGCARCGRDLKGLDEPRCPDCGLEFDWADAVPIERLTCLKCGYHLFGLSETRCPECGTQFTWSEALDNYRRRQNPLFEYQCGKHFIRSAIRTWWWCLRPTKFWKRIDIHDPPQVVPLLIWVLMCLVAFAVSVAVTTGIAQWLPRYMYALSRPARFRRTGWAQLPSWVLRVASNPEFARVVVSVLAWTVFSLVALLVFRQSMRRCRIRTVHVIRVWAYSTPTMLVVAGVTTVIVEILKAELTRGRSRFPFEILVGGVFVAYVMWAQRCAYRHTIRMAHSFGVAICAQLMAVLATMSAGPIGVLLILGVLFWLERF